MKLVSKMFGLCLFLLQWDPNITTLPGLYLASAGLLKPIAELWNIDLVELCTISILRSTNVFFAAGNTYLMFGLLQKLHVKNKVIGIGFNIFC